MSNYVITSKCHSKYTMVFLDNFIDILKNYEIEEERIFNAKRHFKYIYESTKFYNLSSYNDEYKNQILFNKKFIASKEIYKKLLSIKSSRIKEYYKNVFVKDILAKHILFYYSNKNVNKAIVSLYKKHMPASECKTHIIKN